MIPIYPEITNAVRAKDTDKLAQLLRRYFNKTGSHKLDIYEVYRNAELSIQHHRESYYGSVFASDTGGRFKVGVAISATLSGFESEFLLTSLFSRIIWQIQPQILETKIEKQGQKEVSSPLQTYLLGGPTKRLKIDQEVESLAVALFLPRELVLRAQQKLGDGSKLAQFFGVPEEFLAKRLAQIESPQGDNPSPSNFIEAELKIAGASKAKEISNQLDLNQLKAPSNLPKATQPKASLTKAAPKIPDTKDKERPDKESSGLKRLRMLAQKFDPSVKID